MGKHSAPASRRATKPPRRVPWSAIALTVGSVVAWMVLVWFAVRLGPEVKSGELTAIAILVVAGLGAVACLFLGLAQGLKIFDTLRTSPRPARAVRPVGGRRAKR